MQRAVIAFEQNVVGKFQRNVDREQDLPGCAEFDDRVLEKWVLAFARAGAVSVAGWGAMGTADFDGNSHRRGFWKEPGQTADEFGFERARACLAGHSD